MARRPQLDAGERCRWQPSQRLPSSQVAGAAPYLYIVARVEDNPVVVAGTWLDQAQKLDPSWKLEGQLDRLARGRLAVPGGPQRRAAIASRAGRIPSNCITWIAPRNCAVAGIVDAGGAEDNQVFVSLRCRRSRWQICRVRIGLAQLSVAGTAQVVAAYCCALAGALPQYQVRPIRQVAEAEGALLGRIRLLIVSMVLLILVLTALCVLGDHGRAGDGAPRGCGIDEGAGRLDRAHCRIISCRSRRAGRSGWTARHNYWRCVVLLDGPARVRRGDLAAMGSFSADDRVDDRAWRWPGACRCACWASEACRDFARRIGCGDGRSSRKSAQGVRERARARRCVLRRRSRRMDRHHGSIGLGQDHAHQYSWRARHADRPGARWWMAPTWRGWTKPG